MSFKLGCTLSGIKINILLLKFFIKMLIAKHENLFQKLSFPAFKSVYFHTL